MKLTYEKNGDYLIPNLTANKETGTGTDQVRTDEKELSKGTQERDLIRE